MCGRMAQSEADKWLAEIIIDKTIGIQMLSIVVVMMSIIVSPRRIDIVSKASLKYL